MKVSLSRIIIFGKNIDLLKAFYTESFNLSVIEETAGEWVVLNAGATEIALHKIGEHIDSGNDDFRAESNTKLVFKVNTGLHQLRQQLIDKGVAMKEARSFPGISSLFCDGEDPEGNVFQLEERSSN
ncbi:VOC family protein [Mucilaginibacter mali]|uniref:VOC family protein n=1 Tax=Mucilaginibacter mali TaxID=2740462 RepID=A0A7D4PTT6_9SPHI|nr:VOC family protein [Mucilaginibacter mali]QKJ30248.1 VOC family protein [Mucilaginibacter mali]